MLFAVVNYDYFTNSRGPVLRMIGYNDKGERCIVDVQDERLAPHFYILKEDYELFKQMNFNVKVEPGLPTEYDEETVCIKATFPWEIREIRDAIKGIQTFQADVKWEKMVFQMMKWKQFFEIDDYDPYGFTPLDSIHKTDKVFPVELNIAYWDIETRNTESFKDATKIPIISYSLFSKKKKEFIYYAWKEEWEPREYEDFHETRLGEKALKMLSGYPKKFPLTIKLFNNEVDMHKEFIKDFSEMGFDGLMTFNGRGGTRVVGGKKKFFTGYDFPLFYERCVHLGLYDEIQKMSPFYIKPQKYKRHQPAIKRWPVVDDNGIETAVEYHIKGIPQFDIYFDDRVLFYTKNEYEMKRHNLDTFLSHFLGIHKVEHEGEMVWELFDRDWYTEMYYNNVDVEGLYALDLYFNYTNDVYTRAILYGGKTEDGVYASKLHDHIKLWFISDKFVLPTREHGRKIQREGQWNGLLGTKKVGGFNYDVKPIIVGYDKVEFGFIIDFSKLYPSCSRSANVDTRTKINLDHLSLRKDGLWLVDNLGREFLWNDVCRTPAGFFRKDIESIDTIIYNDLITKRNIISSKAGDYMDKFAKTNDETLFKLYKLYNTTQFSYKGLINGKFGANGMEGGRSFDYVVYNSPPSMGQEYIKYVINWLAERGYPTLLASTDSAISIAKSKTAKGAWDEVQSLLVDLNKDLVEYGKREFNIIKNYIKIGCEKIFNVAVIFNKRYYMLNTVIEEEGGKVIDLSDNPRAYFKGMEKVRRSTAKITAEVQDKLMDMVRMREPKEKILSYIRKVDDEFSTYPWSYICTRGGFSGNIDEGKGQRYEAAKNSNKYLGKNYQAGANPLIAVFPKHPLYYNGKYLPNEPIAFLFDENDEYKLKKKGFDIDYEHIKEIVLVKRVKKLIEMLFNMTYQEVIYGSDDVWEL